MARQGWLCFALSLSFSFLLSVSEAKFIVEQHSLTVSSDSIKGTFESAIANFGIPQYGGSMAGQVVYLEGEKAKACDAFKEVFRTGPGDLPKIVLVDRGGMLPSRAYYVRANLCALARQPSVVICLEIVTPIHVKIWSKSTLNETEVSTVSFRAVCWKVFFTVQYQCFL